LEWGFRYGSNLEFYESLHDRGLESPLDNRPTLSTGEIFYYNDFVTLGTERISSGSVGSLPITRIIKFAVMDGVHDVELFKRIILRLDVIYLNMVASERKKAEAKAKAKGKSKKVK